MKKTLLLVSLISILALLGYAGIEMYKFATGVKQDALANDKRKGQDNSNEFVINTGAIESKALKELLLTETTLGNAKLNELDGNNIEQNLKQAFPGFLIKESIGQQDGPDYKLYQVSYINEDIFTISMDGNDAMRVDEVWTKNPKIKDQYGASVGLLIDSILIKRPDIKLHADLHHNIYAAAENSKILYRLSGELKNLNDSLYVSKDFKVELWQVAGMQIDYILWRK